MQTIIVQLLDTEWTTRALHLACAMAHNTESPIVLLYLMLARNPGALGSELAAPNLSDDAYRQLQQYRVICEDYGVQCIFQPMQYVTYIGALTEAISILNAHALFIKLPTSKIEFWQKTKVWWIKRAVHSSGCTLYFVVDDVKMIEWIPAHSHSMHVKV